MFKLFYSPVEAVEEAMDNSVTTTILFLIGASIITGVSSLLLMIGSSAKAMILVGVGTAVGVFIGTLVGALILTVALNLIKSNGIEYKLGLTAVTIGLIVPSAAVLLGILLSYIPYAGEVLATLAIFIGCLLGFGEYFRAISTYFEADFVTIFTAFYVITISAMVAINFGAVRTVIELMLQFMA